MKWFVIFVLLIIGVYSAEVSKTGPRRALRKIVKRALWDIDETYLVRIEAILISNCKANGRLEVQDDLENTYSQMKRCAGRKTIFITPKAEFLANLEECSREAIRKTRNCLAEDQKYFPEFILDLAKSYFTFLYDDFEIMRLDLPSCVRSSQNSDAQREYIQCLTDAVAQTHYTWIIPSSKRSFCDKILPATKCFTEIIKNYCQDSENLRKFRNDYIGAIEVPCGIKK
ncbi:uncharacterized protein [Leptinotarsa decemlineata]|uniref:uncharacterized protein n=1 Tax=Leptinotarsa decemlineata TaxID=7539 RepID=UPI003D304270